MSFVRAIATIGGYTAVSRVLGLVRDMMIASALGAGPIADAFFIAFKFPNFFRRLFGEGTFNSSFVPLFAGMVAGEGKAHALIFAEQALAVLLATLLALTFAAELAMPWAMYVIAPGFESDPVRFNLAIEMTRITFPYLMFVSVAALFSGVLNSLDRFAATAATPILLNVITMITLVSLTPYVSTPGHALSWGVVFSGAAQFVWLAWSLQSARAKLNLPWPRPTPQVKLLLRRMVPGTVGAGIVQINLLVDVMVASLLPTGAVSYLYYADRVNQLPLGIVGAAIGTALLPLLSRQLRTGDHDAATASQNRAIEYGLLFTLPATAGLMALARPITVVLFERGQFGAVETAATANALIAFAIGLPAYVLVKVFTPGFFARGDTATPVKIAVACMILNVVLTLSLMGPFGHVGIALSTAIAALINGGALAFILTRRGQLQIDARTRRTVPRLLAASVLMGVALVFAVDMTPPALLASGILRITMLSLWIAGGMVLFFAAAFLMGAVDRAELMGLLRRRRAAS